MHFYMYWYCIFIYKIYACVATSIGTDNVYCAMNLHTCLWRTGFQAGSLVAAGRARTRDAVFVEGPLLEGLDDLALPGAVDDVAGSFGRHVLVDQELAHQPQQVLCKIWHHKSNIRLRDTEKLFNVFNKLFTNRLFYRSLYTWWALAGSATMAFLATSMLSA